MIKAHTYLVMPNDLQKPGKGMQEFYKNLLNNLVTWKRTKRVIKMET